MRFRKGMIIPFSLFLFFIELLAISESLRSFDDLHRVAGTISRIDSIDVKKKGKRSLFTNTYYRRYYLYVDNGFYKTTKKVVSSLRPADQIIIYTRPAGELFSPILPANNIILHLEHKNKVLIDYKKEQKLWYGITAGIILFAGFSAYYIRKQLRKDPMPDYRGSLVSN